MGKLYPHSIALEKHFVVRIHVYVDRTIFLLIYHDFMMTDTLNLRNWKYK